MPVLVQFSADINSTLKFMGIKCDKCDLEFGDHKALGQHSQSKHSENMIVSEKILKRQEKKDELKAEKMSVAKSEKFGKSLKYGGLFVLLILIGYGVSSFSGEPTGQAIAKPNIPSGPIHWHPHLTIKINSENIVIPANVGLETTIHQPVHTHETDNILHYEIESPTEDNMKLGFFFKVWNKKFNSQCIFDNCNTESKKVKMTVNGKENSEFENYYPKDGDEIVVEY